MLVTAVAQRARQLLSEPEKLENRKPVSVAVEELYEGKIKVEFPDKNN
jgi:DNA-directed RNA polymerase subunit K/omega